MDSPNPSPLTFGPIWQSFDFLAVVVIILLLALAAFLWFRSGIKKRRRKRRRGRLPINPTLAETGGLPPIREEKNSSDQLP